MDAQIGRKVDLSSPERARRPYHPRPKLIRQTPRRGNWDCQDKSVSRQRMDSKYSGFLEVNPTFQDRVEAFTSGLLTPDLNAYIESFNRRFRDELLNAEVFGNLREAQVLVEDYRRRYNHPRPHSSLDYATPAAFAAACLAAGAQPPAS